MPDYIERDRVYEILHSIGGCDAEPNSFADGWDKAIDTAISELDKIPAVDVATDEIDLNPCPFCGTTDDVYSEFDICYIDAEKQHEIRIGCRGCGFYLTLQRKSKGKYITLGEILDFTEQAFEKWNTRSDKF